jgi:hypothetical protein
MLTDEQMAERYFDNFLAPRMRRDGLTTYGIAALRQSYLTHVLADDKARRQLHQHFYPVPSENDEETP